MKLYTHRYEIIMKNDNCKWEIMSSTNYYDVEFSTLDAAKNHIDKYLGGYSGKCAPRRWLKDEKLRGNYNGPYPLEL